MAARAATDSPGISGQADDVGPRLRSPAPVTLASGFAVSGTLVARARRRLVDALMDAGRIRSIRSAVAATDRKPTRVVGFEAADFIGLALSVIAGHSRLPAEGHGSIEPPWPATPALDTLSALFRALEDQRVAPADASLRFGDSDVRRELQCLSRLAVLSASGVKAVVATAPEIAILLVDFEARGEAAGGAAPSVCSTPRARYGAFGVTALESRIEASTVGPGGDNFPDAVVLARLFLRLQPLGAISVRLPCASGHVDRPIGLGSQPKTIPIYPAADRRLFRSIARWRSKDQPPSQRYALDRLLGRPLSHWGRDARGLATLSVGSPEWSALRTQAGCADLRLRVIRGTAIVLVDRSSRAVRDAARHATWALARQGRAVLSPQVCAAVVAAAHAFHGATGQTLVCRRLEGSSLLMAVEVDWIDPWGTRRSDTEAIEAIADVAPLAAIRLLDTARNALSDQSGCWRLAELPRPGGVRQLSVRLNDGLLTPVGG